jgi:PAS domain S-box-containing protein
LLGFNEEELRDKHCVDFSPAEDAEKDWELFQQLRAGLRDHYQLEKRYFRRDGSLVWGSLTVSLLNGHPSPLIIAMVQDITEKKAAEHSLLALNSELRAQTALLQRREELLSTFVKNAPVGVAMFDREMRYLQVSDRWCEDNSLDSSQILGRSHYEIARDLPDRWKESHRRGLEGETLRADEDRWDREGGTKWIRWEVRPWWNLEAKPAGILLLAEDVTQRKQMEEALTEVTGKLIEAQEQERARIGRELHDDVCQRLALLAINLRRVDETSAQQADLLKELRTQLNEISMDIQGLSRDLHASSLEYLGIVAGIESWCFEFGKRHNILINFKSDVRTPISPTIGISLFRITQEALNNALKHSRTDRIDVNLFERANEVHLVIQDAGRGFNIDEVRGGLGLISMRERARLMKGTVNIESKQNGGTKIYVRVPIDVSEGEAA